MKIVKKFLALAVASTISFTMVSCGSKNNKGISRVSNTLFVISKYPEDVMKQISKEFKDETGINVKYKLKDEINEADFKEPNVDIIVGGNEELYNKMTLKKMLKPYKTSWFDKVDHNLRDKEGNWYSIFKNPIVVVYNKINTQANLIPTKLQDLESGKLNNKLVMVNTNNTYTKYFISSTASNLTSISKNDEKVGELFLQNLKLNVATFYNNYDEVIKALNSKDTPIGIVPLDILNKNMKNNPNLININMADGEPTVNECAGILKSTTHENAADMFMEFIAGPKVQLELAQKFNIMPTLPVALKYSPDWIKNFKSINISQKIILENEGKWVGYFNNIIKPENTIKTTPSSTTSAVKK